MKRNYTRLAQTLALLVGLGLTLTVQIAAAKPSAQNKPVLAADALTNATYQLTYVDTPVTLTAGQYEDAAAQIHVEMTEFQAAGDLNGDGSDDAAVILTTNTGGNAPFADLAAVVNDEGVAKPVATTLLGDRIQIQALTIANQQVTVSWVAHGPDDAQCCPTQTITATYTLVGNQLVRKPTKAFGRLLAFPQGNRYGYVNVLGEFAIEPQFVLANEFSEGLASVSLDGQTTGFINRLGEMVIPPQFTYASGFIQGLAIVGIPNPDADQPFVVAYINRRGDLMFDGARFAAAEPFSGDLAVVSLDGKNYGYINRAGRFVIEPQFVYAERFSEGLAAVQLGEKFGYIDTTGQVIIEAQYEFAEPFSEGLAAVHINSKTGYIDHQGKVVIEPQYDYGHDFKAGRALVAMDGREQYIDITGQNLTENLSFTNGQDFVQGLAAVKIDGLFGYLNLDGEVVIEPQFVYAGAFNSDIALAQTTDVQGIIDPTGIWLLALPRFAVDGEVVNLTAATKTQLIDYTPDLPAETRSGFCAGNAQSVASGAAWQCQVDDVLYDPCLTAADGQTLVCGANPARNEPGFQLELTKPLPVAKATTDVPSPIWLFQTGDNATCVIVTNVTVTIADTLITHVCSDGTAILGGVQQSGELWQAEKVHLINDSAGTLAVSSAKQVAVVVAWTRVGP